jgi:hypothetical protein
LIGQYFKIYAANPKEKSMALVGARNSIVTGSFLKHIEMNRN